MRLPAPSEYRHLNVSDKRLVLDQIDLLRMSYLEAERDEQPDRTPIPRMVHRTLSTDWSEQ